MLGPVRSTGWRVLPAPARTDHQKATAPNRSHHESNDVDQHTLQCPPTLTRPEAGPITLAEPWPHQAGRRQVAARTEPSVVSAGGVWALSLSLVGWATRAGYSLEASVASRHSWKISSWILFANSSARAAMSSTPPTPGSSASPAGVDRASSPRLWSSTLST